MRRDVMRATGLVVVYLCAAVAMAQDAPKAVAGKVSAVTLYRGQAQVTRTVPLDGAAGTAEIVVGPLPAQVVPDSLFAEGGEEVHVRAVRHRKRPVGEEPQEQVRDIDRQIEKVEQDMRAAKENLELVQRNRQSLDRFDTLTGPAAAKGAQEGKLEIDADAITKLVAFAFEHRQRLINEMLDLQNRQRVLQEQLALLQRQRNEITALAVQYEHEAVLFINKPAAGNATLRLTYLVNGCGWSPAYNVRAVTGGEQAQVEFNALIQQMSGEEWADVELTLSTATPALSSAAPAMAPFQVGLTRAVQMDLNEALSNTNSGGYAQAQQTKLHALQQSQFEISLDENIRNNWRLNVAGSDLQLLEQVLAPADMDRMRMSAPVVGDAPSLTYTIKDHISLASRADQQLVRVAAMDMPASFHHVALPVLTSFVYREADVTNTSDTDMLGGTISAYLDARFVGRTEIPTVARGQTFVVGFGADPQLRAEKHLALRTESVQGGNQVVSFDYQLRIENFKAKPVTVRVKDRMPYAREGEDLGVTITQMPTELSKDPIYERLERPRQILRWDVQVPANAVGDKATAIAYSYKIAYDKQLTLINPMSARSDERDAGGQTVDESTLIREFERLEKARRAQ